MLRRRLFFLVIISVIHLGFSIGQFSTSLAQEWKFGGKPRGTLKVVDLFLPSASAPWNYAEGLVTLDRDNNVVPCLAKDLRWIDDRTIEFKLRQDVYFHNGEKFDAEVVRINWEEYRKMEQPRICRFVMLPDDTKLEILEEYAVRFILPDPDGIVFHKFEWFFQIAPAFFKKHKFDRNNWGRFSEAGPWGTGPFQNVKGGSRYVTESRQVVLEAFEGYWDIQYPKVQRVIFENSLTGDRKEAMSRCMDSEGSVDIVSFIRPLDTLKVAESRYATVIKSKDVAILFGWFNQRKRGTKWKDVRLRKALNYAINREELLKYAAKGNAHNLGGYIPPGGYGHNPDLSLYAYDTAKAKSLLEEAGYAHGFELKIIASEAWRLEAQIIAKMLERIGLNVTVDVFTLSELHRKFYLPRIEKPPEEQEWDIVIWHTNDYYANTAGTFLTFGFLEESDFRWMKYDQKFENMWKDISRTVDRDTQQEKIRGAVEYLYDSAHALFIYSPISLYAINREVNFVPQKFGILRLKETSVTANHWSLRGKNN
jgi:peptide/nickel transport system substrate-binding protein